MSALPGADFSHYADDEEELDVLEEAVLRRLEWRARNGGKRCSSCQETKPVADFGADSSRRDGLEPRCRACRRVNAESATP